MTINRKSLNKTLGVTAIVVSILVIVTALVLNPPSVAKGDNNNVGKVIAETNGKQLIHITAKAGFTPNSFIAESQKPIILRVSTKNTFDCTSTISIPTLGINKTLPFSGITDIEIPAQASGSTITGTCSMGMYSFSIKVS